MAKNEEMKKPANTVGLNSDRPGDVKAVENLHKLAEVVPGCRDVTGTLRWLCEDEIPFIIEKYKNFGKTLKAS